MNFTNVEFDCIRTRFAPSPTGYLHVGGARTGLFCYLLARRLGGKFLLRIEDTDQARNIESADQKLMDDLRWLGLQWDEGPQTGGPGAPYHQSQRLDIYRAHTRRLLDEGKAYYAFDTSSELDAMRQAAQREKRNFRYPRPASFPSNAQAEAARAAGRPVVVRLKMPDHGFVVKDQILGEVTIGAEELDDFVLVKSDGFPTYHYAVVIDDQHMRVTHVLRGQEHLMNTPRHMALQEALGYRTPVYGHLPIILNMDGSKMSKREKGRVVLAAFEAAVRGGKMDESSALRIAGLSDAEMLAAWRRGDTQLEGGALMRLARSLNVQAPEIEIHDFRVSGYLPEVLVNFIALLGWSAGDDREKFTLEELCTAFSLERIGKTNARFDRAKLLNFNTTAIAAAGAPRRVSALRDYLEVNEPGPLSKLGDAMLARLMEINEGVRVLRDVETKSAALFVRDEEIEYDADAVKQHWLKSDREGLRVLRDVRGALGLLNEWTAATIEPAIRQFAEGAKLGLGKVAQPTRIALTGKTISPSIFASLELLGREKSLGRIDRALRYGEKLQ
ncbi:MAG: glutamate--tRNA ligase [Phycisphaerales bacterium]|nr:glutamate--tRNA ligase [Phycisphaerales bacterium]